MLKSRIGQLPPPKFYADIYAHLLQAYPAAHLNEQTMMALKPFWDQLWLDGRTADVVAKTTCSCDGKTITPSPVLGVAVPRGSYRGPKGAARGQLFDQDEMRESAPVEREQRRAEKYTREVAKIGSLTPNLQQRIAKAKTPEDAARLRVVLQEKAGRLEAAQQEAREAGKRLEELRSKMMSVPRTPKASPSPPASKRGAKASASASEKKTPAAGQASKPKAPARGPRAARSAAPASAAPASAAPPSTNPAAPAGSADDAILARVKDLLPGIAEAIAAKLEK